MRYGFLRYSAHEVLRFWLDRGVDGFRVAVVHCIGKDPHFADDSREDVTAVLTSLEAKAETVKRLL